jgi:S1-C subfamily serine protease
VIGIPIFGVITGLVAILLGSVALGTIGRSRQKGTGLAISGVILGLVDVVGWILFLSYALTRPGPDLQLAHFKPDLAALKNLDPTLDRAMRANVLIQSRAGLFGQATALGSGVILKIQDGDVLILTNRHVIDPDFAEENAQAKDGELGKHPVTIQMVDQAAHSGRVVWIAPGGIDLALVRVVARTQEARATRWKMGRPAAVGEPVFAIGNPHGLGWTHTQGTISQFRIRDLGVHKMRIIQTQTSINAGNSGGGLYDKDGYLIGINTWTEDKRVSEGLNFAIMLDILQTLSPPGLDLRAGSEEELDRP